ncbi:MAG: AAA family ATPase [Rhodobacteraceae bacterium]|nr:AAA family ATPase [Paracoccaceae bacterium]
MAELLRFATAEARPRDPADFVHTETANDILRSLNLIRSIEGTAMTMIAGVPGVGKTRALKHFCSAQGHDSIFLTVACDEGKPSSLAQTLMGFFDRGANGLSLTKTRSLLASYIGAGRVIAVDEAQYLTPAGAEWLRALAESGGIDLVLCGDLSLDVLVSKIPQLYSRMRRPVIINVASKADVLAVAEGSGLNSADEIAALCAIARLSGGLRNVENVVHNARLFAGGSALNAGHLKAAILDLKLTPKGSK